jgi:hypothetical protein
LNEFFDVHIFHTVHIRPCRTEKFLDVKVEQFGEVQSSLHNGLHGLAIGQRVECLNNTYSDDLDL